MFLHAGTTLNSRYGIEKVLGHGGFGITYLAYDQLFQVKVAIKEYLPRQLATRAEGATQVSIYTGESRQHYVYGLSKFLEEAQALARFGDHPNIVSCRDFFEANGTAYMVMPYLEGLTLKEYLAKKGGRLSYEAARDILLLVMDALQEVHRVHLLHRDLSPDNIFLTTSKQVKLIDFGAARYQAGEQSRSLSVILKAGYAPEEQYRSSGRQGPWTDVYGVAATFYKAITGQTPPDALDRLAYDTLVAPSELGAAIPAEAEQTLLKALAVRAVDRLQTIDEFKAGLTSTKPLTQEIKPAAIADVPPVQPRQSVVPNPVVAAGINAQAGASNVQPHLSVPVSKPSFQRSQWISILIPLACLAFLTVAGIAAWGVFKGTKTEVKINVEETGEKIGLLVPPTSLKDQLSKVLFNYKNALENKDKSGLRKCYSPHFPELEKKLQEIETNWKGFDFIGMHYAFEIEKEALNNQNPTTLVKWQFQTRDRKTGEIKSNTMMNRVSFVHEEGQWHIKTTEKIMTPGN
jgi:serine/threonine protein kinase